MDTLIDSLAPIMGPAPDLKLVLLMMLTPLFIAALAIEFLVMRRRRAAQGFVPADIFTNFGLGASYQVMEGIIHTLFAGALLAFAYQFRLTTIEMTPANWLLLILGLEFFYYWFHRSSHRIRWFWCAHVVHHSSELMNLSTAMRQSLTYSLNLSLLFWVPLILLGFPPWAVLLAYGINLAYQYFIHTEAVGKLHPAIEFIFNTPSHHRAHHGRNPRYIDRNYGGILIIWDRLFGTFVEEDAEDPVDYGIPKQVHSYNIIFLNLHEWRDMFRDMLQPGPLWIRLKHLWAPPEWQRTEQTAQSPAQSTVNTH